MADVKLSALTEHTAPATDDEVYVRDISEAASAESKRITLANLLGPALQNYDLSSFLLVGNGGSTGIAISANGEVNMAAQPCVLAYNSANDNNVTGNGATATADFDTEVFDQNADFASDTFTAPVTGRYLICFNCRIAGITSAGDGVTYAIITSNRTHTFVPWNLANNMPTDHGCSMAIIADLDASDTVTCTIVAVGEASDVVDIIGSSSALTTFSCCLLA